MGLMPTMATVTALDMATPVSATLDSAMVDTVLATEATDIPVLATLTARGRLRLSPRLMPSTELTELTPTPLVTVTPVSVTPVLLPLPLPTLPSPPLLLPLLPPLLPTPLPPLPSATPVLATLVSDTLVSDMLVSDTLVLDTFTARGRPRLSPRLMLTTATDTVSDMATPVSDTLVLDTLVSAMATELVSATATVKLVRLSSRSSTQSLPSVLLLKE